MSRRHFYLAVEVAGAALPYWQILPWISLHGLDLPLMVRELFANRVGGFFGLDVLLCAWVLLVFIRLEGRRLGMRLLWLPILCTLLIGVSCGLPAFLYLRERADGCARRIAWPDQLFLPKSCSSSSRARSAALVSAAT